MMIELDVEPVIYTSEDMFDGLEELRKWYNAPTLAIFSRSNKPFLKESRKIINFVEIVPRVDNVEWINEGLKIIEERKCKNSRLLVYSSSS